MISLDAESLEQVKKILKEHIPHRVVWAFGSRVNGQPKPYSDLDLALEGKTPLSLDERARLSDAFSESDLPIRVDIIDLPGIEPAFRQLIEKNRVRLQ